MAVWRSSWQWRTRSFRYFKFAFVVADLKRFLASPSGQRYGRRIVILRGQAMKATRHLLLLFVLLAVAPWVRAVELRDVRLWDGPDSTRVVFDLAGGGAYKTFTLDNPQRIVVDIPGAQKARGLKLDALSRGVVKSVRTGPREGGLRVVLDIEGEVTAKSFGLEPNGSYGHRLIFDLVPKNAPIEAPAPPVETAQEPRLEAPPDARPETKKPGPPVRVEKPIVIAIDAGHGGEDPGARGKHMGLWEKDITLRIAKKLAVLVNDTPGYKAVLTRKGDYFMPLRRRTEVARKAQADLFVSIHANSLPTTREVRGASVYVVSERGATSEHAKMLANLENAADLIGGVELHAQQDDVASVLLDISQTAVREASFDVGSRLLESLGSVNRLQKADVQQAGFAVLKSPDVPSVLVETAFLSHPEDERLLGLDSFQDDLAGSLMAGIREYFGLYRPQQAVAHAGESGELPPVAAPAAAPARAVPVRLKKKQR